MVKKCDLEERVKKMNEILENYHLEDPPETIDYVKATRGLTYNRTVIKKGVRKHR